MAILTFAEYMYIAIVPLIVIGAVFYFYIIPKQQNDNVE